MSREVERSLALGHGDFELFHHNLLAAVVGELQVVGTRHGRGKIAVRHIPRIWSLPHHCQLRVEGLESANRQPGTPGDEPEKLLLLLWLELAHHLN